MRARRFFEFGFRDLGYLARRHFGLCRRYYCAALTCVAAGVIFGVVTGAGLSTSLTQYDVKYIGIINILNVTVRFGNIFWNRLFTYLIMTAAVFFLNCTIFTFPLAHALMAYRGYVAGLNCALLMNMYGVGGFFSALIFIIPHQIGLICFLCVLLATCADARCRCRGGRGGFFPLYFRAAFPALWRLSAFFVVCALLEGVILPLFAAVLPA